MIADNLAMNLDDESLVKRVDTGDMLGFIDDLPNQFENAWNNGRKASLSGDWSAVRQVTICGMGGSSISGELLSTYVSDRCDVPVTVNRHYDLPSYVKGKESLVILLSHSGTTEETLSAAQAAVERGCQLIAITTGGKLGPMIDAAGGSVVSYTYDSPPRAAVGMLYGNLIGAFSQTGLAGDLSEDVTASIKMLNDNLDNLNMASPVDKNKAKRIAGQLVERVPVMWSSDGLLAPVARRWKTQINENSKTAAYFELLPELNHNTVVGCEEPSKMLPRLGIVQLVSRSYDHPRVTLRHKITHKIFLQEAMLTELLYAHGSNRLEQQMNLVQFGDYVSFYLAMAYEIDPTPIGPINTLKARLAEAEIA